MIGWALAFLTIAAVAEIFGIGGIVAASTGVAQAIFVIFLMLFAIGLLAGLFRRN